MNTEVVEEVTRTLASLGQVPRDLQSAVVQEFYDTTMSVNGFGGEGSLDYAKRLLRDSLDPKVADRVMAQIQTQVQKTPFSVPAAGRERELAHVHPGRAPADDRADHLPPRAPQGVGDSCRPADAEADRGHQAPSPTWSRPTQR